MAVVVLYLSAFKAIYLATMGCVVVIVASLSPVHQYQHAFTLLEVFSTKSKLDPE